MIYKLLWHNLPPNYTGKHQGEPLFLTISELGSFYMHYTTHIPSRGIGALVFWLVT